MIITNAIFMGVQLDPWPSPEPSESGWSRAHHRGATVEAFVVMLCASALAPGIRPPGVPCVDHLQKSLVWGETWDEQGDTFRSFEGRVLGCPPVNI